MCASRGLLPPALVGPEWKAKSLDRRGNVALPVTTVAIVVSAKFCHQTFSINITMILNHSWLNSAL